MLFLSFVFFDREFRVGRAYNYQMLCADGTTDVLLLLSAGSGRVVFIELGRGKR